LLSKRDLPANRDEIAGHYFAAVFAQLAARLNHRNRLSLTKDERHYSHEEAFSTRRRTVCDRRKDH
jgi:hypothetical protein